jgi:hypothetical protein
MGESSNRARTRIFWRATVSIVIYGNSGEGLSLQARSGLELILLLHKIWQLI